MKCRIDNGRTCRRCYRAGVPCVFVPRANAAGLPGSVAGDRSQGELSKDVLRRLKVIEDHLGLNLPGGPVDHRTVDSGDYVDSEETPGDKAPNSTLWSAVKCLRACSPTSVDPIIWQQKTIKYLWHT